MNNKIRLKGVWLVLLSLLQFSCVTTIEECFPVPRLADLSISSKGDLWVVFGNGKVNKYLANGSLPQQVDFDSDITNVYFLNQETGWIVGENNQVWQTHDGGNNWQKKGRLSSAIVGGETGQLVFVNSDVGWYAGAFSVFLTEDGGNTWTRKLPNRELSPSDLGSQPVRFYPINNDVGWLETTNNQILKTHDRGNTWQIVSPSQASGIGTLFPFSEKKAYVDTTSGLLFTSDGGENWEQLLDEETKTISNLKLSSIYFKDEDEGWASSSYFIEDEGSKGVLLKTLNGGKSWEKVDIGSEEKSFKKIHFIDDKHGWLIAEESIYKTQNSGKSWKKVADLPYLAETVQRCDTNKQE